MCLNPTRIFTNSHYVSTVHMMPFEQYVPCGHCSECRSLNKSAWRLRAFYEAQRCFQQKGYILFDTLTYAPKYIPWLHDVDQNVRYTYFDGFCFNRKHLQNFMKLLRSWLERDGYDVKDNLRYFISSEMAKDPEYTMRSHYHCLFFVNVPNLDGVKLSRYISLAWPYGRTDGYLYNGLNYLNEKRLFYNTSPYINAVVGYVSKYVTKDIEFDASLRSKIYNICNVLYGSDWNQSVAGRNYFNSLYRQSSNFHLQSQGFGVYALENVSVESIVETNSIPMFVSKKSVKVSVPLPMYYKRKLFYDVVWYNGSRMWRLNELGMRYRQRLLSKTINNYRNRLKDFQFQLHLIDGFNIDAMKKYVDSCLDGRSIDDYINYCLFVKGRIYSCENDLLNPFKAVLNQISEGCYDYNLLKYFQRLIYPCNASTDKLRFGRQVVCFDYPFTSKYALQDVSIMLSKKINYITSEQFFNRFCCNQNISEDYRYYDDLFDLINFITLYIGHNKDYVMKKSELQYKRYKEIGLLK